MATENPDASARGGPAPGSACVAGRFLLLTALGALLVAVGLYLAFFRAVPDQQHSDSVPDPRAEYAGPFRNVSPAVAYVSDALCAECHPARAASYADHPMGRSLLPAARATIPPTGPDFHNPFTAQGSQFLVEAGAGPVRHRRRQLAADSRPAAELDWQVDYVLGSGARGYAYLSDRDGYLFETPISWYSQKQAWDLSPGFGPELLTGRAVVPECLFCHANRAEHVAGTDNHYREPVFDGHAIGCQRCHGPGGLHVAERQKQERAPRRPDTTIVNPRHLEPALREAVCEQCHLTGTRVLHRGRDLYDFRPGLPAPSCWSMFVPAHAPGSEPRAVSHVEQMYESRCFRATEGPERLGCASCHDPHERVPPAQRVAHYRDRCLRCHEQHGCSLPVAERLRRTAEDSCIACHMPRYRSSDIPHTAATDHRILRHGKATPPEDVRPAGGDAWPVVSFYPGRKGTEGEDERDRAVAVVRLALRGETAASGALGKALPALDAALRRAPDDHVAGEARGHALGLRGLWAEALNAFEGVLAGAPDRELALVGAAAAAEAAGKAEAARDYWRRAVAINSWAPDYRRRLVQLLVKRERWAEAEPQAAAWVRLDPMSAEARTARVQCLLAAGRKEEARAEFAHIEALAPPNLRELQIRFEKRLK
jgi:hypothetical protein